MGIGRHGLSLGILPAIESRPTVLNAVESSLG